MLNVRQAMTQRRLRRLAVDAPRPDLLVADPARFRLPLSARPASRARRSAAAASGTATPTGPTTRSSATFNRHAAQRGRRQRLTNAKVLDVTNALAGRRLCENTVGLLEEQRHRVLESPGAVDKTEWVSQIRTVTAIFPPYQIQEDGHPSYWGQLALRNCLRQAFNSGAPRGGSCTIGGTGLVGGEPNMRFVSTG